MRSLSAAAGDFVLGVVERCYSFQDLPPNLADAIEKLERYESPSPSVHCELTLVNSRLSTITSECRRMSGKSFISCLLQNATFKAELDGLKGLLQSAIQEFQVNIASITRARGPNRR